MIESIFTKWQLGSIRLNQSRRLFSKPDQHGNGNICNGQPAPEGIRVAPYPRATNCKNFTVQAGMENRRNLFVVGPHASRTTPIGCRVQVEEAAVT
jgi:hypothetical protein